MLRTRGAVHLAKEMEWSHCSVHTHTVWFGSRYVLPTLYIILGANLSLREYSLPSRFIRYLIFIEVI